MRPKEKLRIAITTIIVIILSCGTANAQRWRSRPYRVLTVVTRLDVTVHVGNRFTQKERFWMAMAYLKNHGYLTVKGYAKMTELSNAAAKAELDAFVADKDRPIEALMRGKKKVYILKK